MAENIELGNENLDAGQGAEGAAEGFQDDAGQGAADGADAGLGGKEADAADGEASPAHGRDPQARRRRRRHCLRHHACPGRAGEGAVQDEVKGNS